MHPEATHWCYLTMVRGKFRGFGERVVVRVENGTWVLSGTSKAEGVGGRANCIDLALLKPASGVRWTSGPFARQWGNPGGCVRNPIQAWWGDAATAISGFGGDYRGGGESIEVVQSLDPFKATQATIRTCRGQALGAVTSFFVGQPQAGHLARFVGPPASSVSNNEANVYAAWHGSGTIPMLKVDEAMCYFTFISGGFHGGGESASIFIENGRWALRADSKSGDGVVARARCFLLDQGG